jgi:hypothetical protein
MAPAHRVTRRPLGALLALGWLAVDAGTSWAQGPSGDCRVEIRIEEHPTPEPLRRKLQEQARRLGACTRAWTIRISPGPRGQYVLALWNGSDLETRWASNAQEVEAVAELLLRVAVEHAPPDPPASGSAPPGGGDPSDGGVKDGGAAPGGGVADGGAAAGGGTPGEAGVVPALTLGAFAGVGWYASSGVGGEGGGLLRYGSRWGVGLQPGVGRSWGASAHRTDMHLLLVGSYLAPVAERLRLGVSAGVGPEVSWATGTDQGMQVEDRGAGVLFGVWPELWIGDHLQLSMPVRYATTSAPEKHQVVQTTIDKNKPNTPDPPGNPDKPDKPDKEVTTTTTMTAPSVGEHLGGWSITLRLGWVY